jgi:hypothetical protein
VTAFDATPDPEAVDRLIARVPITTRTEVAETLATLATLGPVVAEAMRRILPLTGAVEEAMMWPADLSPAELQPVTDANFEAASDRLGLGALWGLADELLDAHPDRVESWEPL